jgi:isocitrate dehydrogenase
MASVMMLAHLKEEPLALRIHNAWLCTLEEGIHTYDIFNEKQSKKKVGTQEFAQAVVRNLGNVPKQLKAPVYKSATKIAPLLSKHVVKTVRRLVGADVYIYSKESAKTFVKKMTSLHPTPLKLTAILNRGARIWPDGFPETFCIEQWRCRFVHEGGIDFHDVVTLLENLHKSGYDVIKVENLYTFDGAAGYS